MAMSLSEEDVRRLMVDPSGDTRADTAGKLARDIDSPTLTDRERTLANEILRLMVRDAEVRVREALSQNLKDSHSVPHDVAVALARDVDSVAVPMLEVSAVLTDADLLEIVRSQGPTKQTAIAKRPQVSEAVSDALVEGGHEGVVLTLVGNPGAQLTDMTLDRVVETFPDSDALRGALVARPSLPITIAERLVTLVSDRLKDEISRRHPVSSEMAIDLLLAARERAVLNLSTEGDEGDLGRMVKQMNKHGRLTPSIVLRALCLGDLPFFEAALAELADLPLTNARRLIHDPGARGLSAIYKKASLPKSHLPVARAAIAVVRDTHYDGEANDRERFKRRMVDRLLTQFDFLGNDFDPNDIEYLLAKVGALSSGGVD